MQTFLQFTEAAGQIADVDELARLALDTLRTLIPGANVVLTELTPTHWHLRQWTDNLDPDLLATARQHGFPLDTPVFAELLRTGEPSFTDGWNEHEQEVAHTAQFQAVAHYPIRQSGRVVAAIGVAVTDQWHWTQTQQAIVRSIGRSFTFLYDRLSAAEQLQRQRDEAEQRSHALGAFVRFTEASSQIHDLETLVQLAMSTISVVLPGGFSALYQRQPGRWALIQASEGMDPLLKQHLLEQGLPEDAPALVALEQTREMVFLDGPEIAAQDVDHVEEFQAIAAYPILQEGEAIRALGFSLAPGARWIPQSKAIAMAIGRSFSLLYERIETARQLQVQRDVAQRRGEALEAFAALSRDLVSETDRYALVKHAQEIVLSLLGAGHSIYWELEGNHWRRKAQTGDVGHPELQRLIDHGMPFDTPTMQTPWNTGEEFYQDVYPHGIETPPDVIRQVNAVASLPLRVEGEPIGVFAVALFTQLHWSPADRAMLETAVQSLELALDRAAAVQQLRAQQVEAQRRAAALEAFAVLSRDLSEETDRYVLIKHAQEIMLSLLTPGYALYWEAGDARWILRSQVGDIGDPALQRLVDEQGLPLDAPALLSTWQTGIPNYQDHYAQGADTPAEMIRHVQAATAFQVRVRGEPIGMLAIGLFDQRRWTPIDRAVLETAIHSLGLMLERAQSVAALEQANVELQASNGELEAFTYSASHDLRTPVRHVMGFAELAERTLEKTPNEQAQQYLKVVKQAALRMTTLIDGMLLLSRSGRQDVHLQPVDLNLLATQARRDAASEFGSHPVRWQIGHLPTVQGDHSLLQQVMTNLLSNAVKYSAKREISEVTVWCEESTSEWTITVRDNGIGFEPVYAQKLFGVFQRLHNEKDFKGTGIGLATVRRIVQRHGGQVFAQSDGQTGATFGFTLPKEGQRPQTLL